jgi:hypothetical protein
MPTPVTAPTPLTALIAAGACAVAWLVLARIVVATSELPYPAAPPASMDLGPEPPAVAALLVENWQLPLGAVAATIVDLAARGYLSLQEVGTGATLCRVVRDPDMSLTSYERLALEHVRSLVSGGVVPVDALTTGPDERSTQWQKRFTASVLDDAARRGLSRRRGPAVRAALTLAALAPAFLAGIAVRGWYEHHASGEAWLWGPFAGVIVFSALRLVIRPLRRPRRTDAGQAALTRWLAVRAQLTDDTFAGVGPGAVVVWNRQLAYAIALGAVPSAVTAMPTGSDPSGLVWSSYGGRWRRVKVKSGASLGFRPATAILFSLPVLVILIPATLLTYGVLTSSYIRNPWIVGALILLDALYGFGVWWALRTIGRGIGDLVSAPRTLEGQVVYLNHLVIRDDDGRVSETYEAAVDDGTSDEIRTMPVSAHTYQRLNRGSTARVTVTPYLRTVLAFDIVTAPSTAGTRDRATSPWHDGAGIGP